jgi:putative transposase
MPRKIVPPNIDHPYHVTARCHNREWFELPLPQVWNVMENYLFLVSKLYEIKIHAFVLMPNHFHLLISTPSANLGETMRYFMRESSREINRLSGRINQTYGSRYHCSLVPSFHYYMTVYKYIYRNPVRASLCELVEEYPFSTLNGLLGQRPLFIPLADDQLIFSPQFSDSTISWLNQKTETGLDEEVRIALKRPTFSFSTDRNTGKPSVLESSLL